MGCLKCLDLKCKVITPIMNYGINVKIPELREASLKGMIRYWWRAITTWDDTKEMYKYESMLFGDSKGVKGKSPLRIKFKVNDTITCKYALRPHKEYERERTKIIGYCPEAQYYMIKLCIDETLLDKDFFEYTNLTSDMYVELIKDLMVVAFILGGLGKRTRRGYGSSVIEEIDGSILQIDEHNVGQVLVNALNSISKKVRKKEIYQLRDTNTIINVSGIKTYYPSIQKIEIGKRKFSDYDTLLKMISKKSHDIKYKFNTLALGNINYTYNKFKINRYASPIYVSTYQFNNHLYPIITTLAMPYDIKKILTEEDYDAQNEFRGEILWDNRTY